MSRAGTLALLLLACPVLAEPTAYRIDAAHTSAQFEVDHFGVFHTRGRFADLTGRLAYDSVARAGNITLDIAAASVATDWEARDTFLRGSSMFDTAQHPRIGFQSTRFEFAGELVRVAGNLTLRGITRPVTLDVRRMRCDPDACTADVYGTIRRREFGMDALWPLLGDDVDLRISIRAVRE